MVRVGSYKISLFATCPTSVYYRCFLWNVDALSGINQIDVGDLRVSGG